MTTDIEAELFRQSQAGNRAAFDRLRSQLETPIRSFIRRLIGRSDVEEDILQDTFIALYIHRRAVEPENLRPYLYRIARNCCYDELRRRGRFQTVSLDSPPVGGDLPLPVLIDPRQRPDERLHWTHLYAQVQAAIHRLPELQRQTLILSIGERLSMAQVAYAMQTDVATVKSRLHLARQTLMKRLPYEALEAIGLTKGKHTGSIDRITNK